jgi:hypothetical protein
MLCLLTSIVLRNSYPLLGPPPDLCGFVQVVLQPDRFLSDLTSMYERSTEKGSVWVTMKRCEWSLYCVLICWLERLRSWGLTWCGVVVIFLGGSDSEEQGTVAEDGEEGAGGWAQVPRPRLWWQEEHLYLGTVTILVLLLGLVLDKIAGVVHTL